jgi:hypothetical protein
MHTGAGRGGQAAPAQAGELQKASCVAADGPGRDAPILHFSIQIYIPLPCAEARKAMIRNHLGNETHGAKPRGGWVELQTFLAAV